MFSVVLPTRERSDLLHAAINSVFSQTVPDWELIVAVDGEDPDTDQCLAAFNDARLRVLSLPRRGGAAAAREAACHEARGELVAYIDHDDRWDTDHLAVLGSMFAAGADLAFTGARYENAVGEQVTHTTPLQLIWHRELLNLDPLVEPSRLAHRRSLLEHAGTWKAGGKGLEDWAMWRRLTQTELVVKSTARLTASLLLAPTTSRHALRARFKIPVAEVQGRTVLEALDALDKDSALQAGREAHEADALEWLRELDAGGQLIRPDDLPLDQLLTDEEPRDRSPFGGLVVTATSCGVLASLPLLVDDAAHMREAVTTFRRRCRRWANCVSSIISPH